MYAAQLVAHLGIHHHQPQRAGATCQTIAAHQIGQMQIGMFDQALQIEGLRDTTEFGATGTANQL